MFFFIAVLRTYGDSSFFRVLPIVETLKVLLPFSKYFLKDFGKEIIFLKDFGRKKITEKTPLFRFQYYGENTKKRSIPIGTQNDYKKKHIISG